MSEQSVWMTTAVAAERYGFVNRQAFREWAERNDVTLIRRGHRSRTLIATARDVEAVFINCRTSQPLTTKPEKKRAISSD